MTGVFIQSILENTPYPISLYYSVINRIRSDSDNPEMGIQKINYRRASIIKAYLTRKYRNQNNFQINEVLKMSLNEQSTNIAYLLGRLFAILEKVQQEAIGDVNASIKDRFFTSACASPAIVFPQLLRLSQHHIAKSQYGYVTDNRIENIMNLINMSEHPFPTHLSLDEQGIFILGYYHQRTAFYSNKKEDVQTIEEK